MDDMPAARDAAHVFARIARELATQGDLKSTTGRVVELAQTVLACDSTAIWSMTSQGQAKLHASTTLVLAERFNEILSEVREGVAWSCLQSHATIRVEDIRTDFRWPAYRAKVLEEDDPFLSAVGYSLDIGGRSMGALIMASRQPHFFTDDRVDIGAMFAEHATIGIEAATSLERAQNLEVAVTSNRRIGIAIGILMTEYRIQEQEAFDMLRVFSQHQHHKIRDVAEDVILTGALPEWPQRRPA
ncbi:GAF and ANTAR domain-containing protein [Jatrophihabitans sp. DSM 45814]